MSEANVMKPMQGQKGGERKKKKAGRRLVSMQIIAT
jgi:hypothetical protein